AEELDAVLKRPAASEEFPFLFAVRRLRGVMNSLGIGMSGSRRLHPVNHLFIHPEDLAALGLADGDPVRIESASGSLQGLAQADATLRRGVVSMSHCWGGLPGEEDAYFEV